MARFFSFSFLIINIFFIFGCSSGDCTKIIRVPELVIQTPTGSSYNPGYNMEVACDYEIKPIQENTKELTGFTYEIVKFSHTEDLDKNTRRFQLEIKLNNPNTFKAVGYPYLTIDNDGTVSSGGFLSGATSPCYGIDAKSSCTFTFDKEESLSIGTVKSIKILSVKYMLTE